MSQANISKSHKSGSGKASVKGSEHKSIGKLGDQSEIAFPEESIVESKKSKKSNKPMTEESFDYNKFIPEMDQEKHRQAYEGFKEVEQSRKESSRKDTVRTKQSMGGKTNSTHVTKNTGQKLKDFLKEQEEGADAEPEPIRKQSVKQQFATDNMAEEYLKKDKLGMSGEWGADQVLASNIPGGVSKLGFDNRGTSRKQVGEIRSRLQDIYRSQTHPPECFVAQMAFTALNSFLLTTDGRVFSWGALTYSLGRKVSQSNPEKNSTGLGANKKLTNQKLTQQSLDIGEIDFGASTTIVRIATGRSHVLALDSKGKVYSWGTNEKAQLGHAGTDVTVKDTPHKIQKLKDVVQIYAGDQGSFAVDQYGDIYAWGLNKNNALLVNQPEKGMVKTLIEEPALVQLPDYFIRVNRQPIAIDQNLNDGYDFYTSQKPVKSEASSIREDMERLREENARLRKKTIGLQQKIQKVSANSMNQQEAKPEAGDEGAKNEELQFEKHCSNDKVIQSIKDLIEKNKTNKLILQESYKDLQLNQRKMNSEVEQLNRQITDLEKKEREIVQQIMDSIKQKTENAGQSSEAKSELKKFEKQKAQEKKDITRANDARKTQLHQQLVQKTKIEFELKEQLNKAKNDIDTATDNAKIYQEVIQERRRFIMSSYVMKGQEDLEMILETLHDHFKLIKLTSFEELARNNSMNLSAKMLLELSNKELKQLARTLDLLKMDEDDVRFDIFSMIYDMLFDNVQLRIKQNKLSGRILTQANLNIDKMVTGYFRKNHKMINGAIELSSLKFRTKLQEQKNVSKDGGKTKGAPEQETPGTFKQTTQGQDEYYDEEEDERREEMEMMESAKNLRKDTDPNKSKDSKKKENSKQIDYSADPEEDNDFMGEFEQAEEPEFMNDLMMDDDDIFGGGSKPKGNQQSLKKKKQNPDEMDFYGMDDMDMQDDWDEGDMMDDSWQEKEGGSKSKSSYQYSESDWSSQKSKQKKSKKK